MAVRDKNSPVILIKKFTGFEDKEIYRGTYRKALKLIPPSQANRYEIIFQDQNVLIGIVLI